MFKTEWEYFVFIEVMLVKRAYLNEYAFLIQEKLVNHGKITRVVALKPRTDQLCCFVRGLFIWVMQQNNAREKRYQGTIDKLTDALGDVEAIKSTVEKIHEKLQ